MSWDDPFSEEMLSHSILSVLRKRLKEHRYAEKALSSLLDVEAPSIRTQVDRQLQIWRLRDTSEPLCVLARLFYLGDEVERREITPIFGGDELEQLLHFGILTVGRQTPDTLHAPVGITPCWGSLVLSDSPASDPDAVYGPGGPVMGPGSDTEVLLRATPRAEIQNVLDIGTGPGTQALASAKHAVRVTGIDIAPRALAFARVNAWLNEIDNLDLVPADVTDDGENDRLPQGPYDLVLANPPFVPTIEAEFLYRDGGGRLGDRVLNAIIGRLETLLGPAGQARIITDIAFREGETLHTKLQNTLGQRFEHFDIATYQDVAFDLQEYAEFHSVRPVQGRMVQEPGAARALLAHYEEVGISRIAAVLLAFRRTAPPGRHHFGKVSSLLRLKASHVDRLFALWTRLKQRDPQDLVMAAAPTPHPQVTLVHRIPLGDDRQETFEIDFGEQAPWLTGRTTPQMCDLLGLCDGRRTGREVVQKLQERTGLTAEQAQAFVTKAILSLAEFDVLDLVESNAAA